MAMMGWGAYLSQYQRRTDEEKQELWDEIEPEILIYDLTKKDNQIKELKKANSKIDDLAKQVEEIKNQQFEAQKTIAHAIVEGTAADLEEYMARGGKFPDSELAVVIKSELDDRLYNQLAKLEKTTGKKYKVDTKKIGISKKMWKEYEEKLGKEE